MNERSKTLAGTATALTLAILLSACAAGRSQARRDPAQIFTAADANSDGIVTRAEFLAARATNFSKYDRNGDGFIDAHDVPRRMRARGNAAERVDALIDRFDTNHDGRISRAEFVDGPTNAFDLADRNHDGQLSKEEVDAAANAVKSNR